MNGDWEKRIEKIENTTDSIQAHVNEIKLALTGSDKIGLKGFATRMEDAECYIEKDKKQKWVLSGIIIVVASAAATFWNKIFS